MPTRVPFIAELLPRLVARMGAKLYLEPEQQRIGYIEFANGRRCFFRDNRFDLNTLGAVNVARDKFFCSILLKHFGYRVPREISFWPKGKFRGASMQRHVSHAIAFARRVGYPVFVKPANRSQGLAVSLAQNPSDLRRAAAAVFEVSDVAIVQTPCRGKDFRLVVLDGEVISAYERIPLQVLGDGRSTIRQLLIRRQAAFVERGRDTTIRLVPAIRRRLEELGMTLRSCPAAGRIVRLLDVANLSLGGESRDVTVDLHPSVRTLAKNIASDLNLRFCGIDLFARDLSRPDPKCVILEVNASPGLDHYADLDPDRQQAIVEELYLRVLRRIEAGPRARK